MTWNHRIVKKQHLIGDEIHYTYGIHECHYDDKGKVHSCTVEPVTIGGDEVKDIVWTLKHIQSALTKETLNFDNIPEDEAVSPWDEVDKIVTKHSKSKKKFKNRRGCNKC
jgi:hypothetical protein